MKRTYRCEKNSYKDELSWIFSQDEPVYFFNLETTGLDKEKDEIVQIGIVKCEILDHSFVPTDRFSTFVKPSCGIAEKASAISGITDETVKDAPCISEAMKAAIQFTGTNPILAGYNCRSFSVPFLKAAGFMTGEMIYPQRILDIYDIARSVIPKGGAISSYSCRAVALYFGIENDTSFHDALSDAETYIHILEELLKLVPCGTEDAVIQEVRYWEKSRTTRFLFITTNRGRVSINAVNGFWTEETPGFFDEVDLDRLTAYIFEKKHVDSVWDFIKLYQK